MKPDGQNFLEELASLPPDTFESRFSYISVRLGLGAVLDRNELKLLYEAACCANVCNIAINDTGTRGGQILPEDEARRSRREGEFMVAREVFSASPGWQTLSDSKRAQIERNFLRVFVADDKLAW